MSKIHFFYNETKFKLDKRNKLLLKQWLKQLIQQFEYQLVELNYTFCSDTVLSQYNLHYLQHNTLTDIITFDNSDNSQEIEGDILISIERVQENAQKYEVTFEQELHRVMAHGLLHLLGFKDKKPQEKQEMRHQEDICLKILAELTPKNPA